MWLAGGHAAVPLRLRQGPARPGIDRALGAVRRGGRAQHVGPAAEAGIQQVAGAQRVQYGLIVGKMLRLHADRPVPVQPQPGEVLQDGGGEDGAAPRGVDVLQPQ